MADVNSTSSSLLMDGNFSAVNGSQLHHPYGGELGDGNQLFLTKKDFLPDGFPDDLRSLFTVLFVVIIVLAVTGNATTVLVIAVNRDMRTVTNIFLLSLAISDALIAVVNMPVQLIFYLENEWTMGEAMCKFVPYLQGVVIVTSILTLTALAIDRFYAICHPLRARHVHTPTRAIVLASVIWTAALLLVIPQIFIQRLEPKLVFETMRFAEVCVEYFPDERLAVAYTFVFYVVLYIFPVATMFATYGTIAMRLWNRRPIGESADSQRESNRRLREKQRIVRMLVVVVALFAISWFPFFTLQIYLLFDGDQHQHLLSFRIATAVFHLVGYSNSCINPIIYCFMNDSFQKNFFKTIRCQWATRQQAGKRRRSSCTDADRVNGAATASTRNSAIDHSTTV